MRTALLFAFLVAGSFSNAQNWALINPAYKYNYSNDGSDTISNQVFVTHIDTLGVDSFRYELNRVAVHCDTCGTGGSTVLLRLDEPQFLGGEVTHAENRWHFRNGLSFVLFPEAMEGMTWLMDSVNTVWAEMGPTLIGTPFDLLEERRSIQLTTGDSIVIGQDHGILHWPSDKDLIGVNGPDIGTLIPGLVDLFPYEIGDVLQYATWYGGCDAIGGCFGDQRDYKFTVASAGEVQDSAIVFEGWMIEHTDHYFQNNIGSPTYHIHNYLNQAATWSAGTPEYPWPELIFSYPGQLVRTTHRVSLDDTWPVLCVAEHGLDASGRYIIGCRSLGDGSFLFDQEPQPADDGYSAFTGPEDYCPGGTQPDCGVRYTAGLGLEWFIGNYFERGESYVLSGAILGGDTLGTITPDDILLGLRETSLIDTSFFPNPANDQLQLRSATPGTTYTILDLNGRILATHKITATTESINVQHLQPGAYLLKIEGMTAQRFMIMR